jgi:hypothetical protein
VAMSGRRTDCAVSYSAGLDFIGRTG